MTATKARNVRFSDMKPRSIDPSPRSSSGAGMLVPRLVMATVSKNFIDAAGTSPATTISSVILKSFGPGIVSVRTT